MAVFHISSTKRLKGAKMTANHVSYNILPELRLPDLALQVTDATKSFRSANGNGQKRSWSLPFRRTDNDGREPDNGKKRVVAVNQVSFQVRRNEIFGILGANGSGKSTLIRLISTLLTPDTGSVSVFGYDVVRDHMAVKRLINRVSVDAAFFKKLSPMENLMYGARLYGLDGDYAGQRIVEILKRLVGGHVARHAAEGRHRSRLPDLADPSAAGRAHHRPRSSVQTRRSDLCAGDAPRSRRHHRADHA
jgi:ABC-type multidrug transport system fused ATPase/permease subunit